MQRYLAHAGPFGEFIRGVHLVTDEPSKQGVDPAWLRAEKAVIGAGLPFHALEDYRGFLRRAIKPPGSPIVYGISRRGTVVLEGRLESVELWDMLSDVGHLRNSGR